VRELLAATALPDRKVKVHGIIERIESEKRPLRFTIRDKANADQKVPVFCDRSRPDTFQVDYDVAVEGKLDAASGEFKADQIYTKCPSKYEAEEKYGRTSPVKAEAPRVAPLATRPGQ
jgi:cytochrome c-type biogenesis protein CcmE